MPQSLDPGSARERGETIRARRNGSALVIVLFFVVLLSIVTIAFLSRSLTAVKVSSESAGETKSKFLASSASDTIIGDFKQEIIAGSTNFAGGSNPNSGANAAWPIYTPTSNLCAIPFMDGVPTAGSPATNAIPNLISRSVSTNNTGGAAPYVAYPTTLYTSTLTPPNRAASDPTAANPTFTPTSAPYTTSLVNSYRPSLNGRFVTPAQWNEHYLIPRNSPGSGTDPTPVSNFVPPDWVVVTRGGINSVTWKSGTGGLNDPTLTNTNCAVGRYAYAVYNEGGLLDMNAAGYPADPNLTTTTTPPFYSGTPNGLAPTQSSEKFGLPLADLTQLTVGTTTLTQTQVNNLVGWRNYASAEPPSLGGSFGSFTFTQANASNWLTNFVMGNTNGYMQIVAPGSGVTTPPTDQAFLSRQQLISVTQSLSINPDFLQYMGTFSRGLEQPSIIPDPNRPTILTGTISPQTVADGYLGNNDNQTKDAADNPAFLSITTTGGFTRLSGAAAVANEPLVKTKFPLQYLTWLTYKGPSATRTAVINNTASANSSPSSTDYDIYLLEYKYGIPNSLLQLGTAANILKAFGLTYTSATSSWTYRSGQTSINTLSSVTGREPDFAELLKAAIIAGSVGKGGPNLNSNLAGTSPTSGAPNYNYQYSVDTVSDVQVLQIMANLIDQQSVDSYPTAITMTSPSSISSAIPTSTVYGVKDLPYFYRFNQFAVVNREPSPLIPSTSMVSISPPPAGGTTGTTPYATAYPTGASGSNSTWSLSNTTTVTLNRCQLGTLSDPGELTYMFIPTVWNPHDPNTISMDNTTLRPNNFRIFAAFDDPYQSTTAWTPVLECQISGSQTVVPPTPNPTNIQPASGYAAVLPEQDGHNNYFWPMASSHNSDAATSYAVPSNLGGTTPANATLFFSDGNGTLFREPTLLWNTNPTGINLSGAHVSDAASGNINPPQTYYGIIMGQSPISTQFTLTSSPAQSSDGTYVIQGADTFAGVYNTGAAIYPGLTLNQYCPGSYGTSFPQVTFFLQYQDPANASNWITYDVKYPDYHGISAPTPIVNIADFPSGSYLNPLNNGRFSWAVAAMDPRSARWGMGTNVGLGNYPGHAQVAYALEPLANANFFLNTSTGYQNMQTSQFSVFESNRPRVDAGDQVDYSNPCMTINPLGGVTAPPATQGFRNLQMRWFSPGEYRAGSAYAAGPADYDGLFSQNNPSIQPSTSPTLAQNGTTADQIYNEDPDGVARPAMGAYATTSIVAGSSTAGLPLVTANTFNNNAVGTATSQSQSRPTVLNRPFRNVAEMSYAFRGTPWKNIDFFHPASGDSALLDTFCVVPPPANGIVAGKVDLNTRQIPVLQALIAGGCIDEINNASATPPNYALPGLKGNEALNVATTLQAITSDTTHAWRGPLENISWLVGRFVANPGSTSDTDLYTYSPPALASGTTLPTVHYAGLSSALDCSSFNGVANHDFANSSTPAIQRFRESAIRPLAAAGQVRVWNLLIDVVAQSGHYPKTATGLDQFVVDGQTHLWVHVAIDRYTGQVIDKQIEAVTP